MTDNNGSRSGSLQFWPRSRAKKIVPSVNWNAIEGNQIGILGFIGYKVGMTSVWAKDDTADSLTKGKKIAIPATIIECPTMKIYSVRFYKGGKVVRDVVVSNERGLRKSVKVPKEAKKLDDFSDFDDVRVIIYTEVRKTGIGKKMPDMLEFALSGRKEEKMKFINDKIGKEISVGEVFGKGLVDVRGVTKGHGTGGPVKRFGIALKDHKSEKGQRRPGSLAPWHPARVTFRTAMAGQTGYQTRVVYNNLILKVGKIVDGNINLSGGFKHYGNVKNDYLVLRGSIPGPKKRGLVITPAMRPNKTQSKKKFEVLELR